MTKQIRISENTHSKLRLYTVKNKESIIAFADKAIRDALELARLRAKNLKSAK